MKRIYFEILLEIKNYFLKKLNLKFSLYLNGDCGSTELEKPYRAWFFFRVTKHNPNSHYIFTIKNIIG
jgi:hypothetical protein